MKNKVIYQRDDNGKVSSGKITPPSVYHDPDLNDNPQKPDKTNITNE